MRQLIRAGGHARNSSVLWRSATAWPLLVSVGLTLGCENKSGGGLGSDSANVAAGGSSGVTGFTDSAAGSSSANGSGATSGSGGDGSGMASDPTQPAACAAIVGLPTNVDCGSQAGTATIRKPNMLIVLDKSGSQTSTEGFGEVTNWEALNEALETALTEVSGVMAFGLELYPDQGIAFDCQPNDCCKASGALQVPVGPGTKTVPMILDAIAETDPAGGTPTAAGLRAALEYYTEGAGAELEGEKFVMLATDGGPNCNINNDCAAAPERCTINLENRCKAENTNCCEVQPLACVDDDETIAAIAALRDAGIDTFVVGIPGSEGYAPFLDAFAEAGGRINPQGSDKYYAVDGSGGVEGLTSVFQDITTQLIQTCDFELESSPPDPEKVNVALDCKIVSRGQEQSMQSGEADDAGSEGGGQWTLDETTSPPTVTLLGQTCDNVKQNGVERIDFIFGCPTIR